MDDLERWRAPRLAATREGTPCARVLVGVRRPRRADERAGDARARQARRGRVVVGTRHARGEGDRGGVAENAVTESLDVSRNQIGDDGVSALCLAATRAKRLSALILARIGFRARSGRRVRRR